MSASPPALLLDNIGQLITLDTGWDDSKGPRRGDTMRELRVIADAAVLCVAGNIEYADDRKEVQTRAARFRAGEIMRFDCQAGVVVPGFCDSHTHPAFMQPRLIDFQKRIAGSSYEEIAQAGGGIASSTQAVRAASESELEEQIESALRRMALEGTTTVEAKSGYGLDFESEMKSLRAIRNAASRRPGLVLSTLLAAHVVPSEYHDRRDEYIELVCELMVPQVAQEQLADFVDVFCDRGAFTYKEAERVFSAAKRYGLGIRAHVGQFTNAEVARLAKFHPAALDHLDHIDEAGIRFLSTVNTVATLVPGANFFLGNREFAAARQLIDANVAVALATDFNPGTSPITSMPFVLSLACTQMKMSPEEALVAATINGAHALRVAASKGSLRPGKDADLALFGVDDYREIPYWVAGGNCLVTVVRGELID